MNHAADCLGTPLGRLAAHQIDAINAIVQVTLNKQDVLAQVRAYMVNTKKKPHHAE